MEEAIVIAWLVAFVVLVVGLFGTFPVATMIGMGAIFIGLSVILAGLGIQNHL